MTAPAWVRQEDAAPVFEVLIASVHSRHDQLVTLLEGLAAQIKPWAGSVRVIVDIDGGEMPVGMKRNRLLLAATAGWTCFVDDDDQVAPDYVARIMEALRDDPDYVGSEILYSINGHRQKPVYHSLRFGHWSDDEHGYYRGVSHLNPLRREYALTGLPFQPGFGEDKAWAERVQATGLVQREVFLDGDALYHYRYSTTGSLFKGASPHGEARPLPELQYVRCLGQDC